MLMDTYKDNLNHNKSEHKPCFVYPFFKLFFCFEKQRKTTYLVYFYIFFYFLCFIKKNTKFN